MNNLDKYAYASRLKKIDPIQKFGFSILTLGVCLWADNYIISMIILLIMGYATVKVGGTPLRFFIKLMLVPMSFLIIGVLTIAINISKKPDIFLYSIPIATSWIGVSKVGVYEAGRLFFKVLGSVSCLYFLSLSTPMVDLLSVLRRFKVPKLMVELMSLVYRFIFILLETADTMFIAQNSRLGYINMPTGYRSLGALASTLFIRSYKRSNDLFTSLESRGYDGDLNVLDETYEKSNKMTFCTVMVNSFLILATILLK